MDDAKRDNLNSEKVIVSKLGDERFADFKALRLESLLKEPKAFASSYEEEIKFPDEVWKSRMGNMLFAIYKNQIVGMIGFLPRSRLKTGHVADIFSFYVSKEYRGLGAGRELLTESLLKIGKNQEIRKITLSVNIEMEAAIHLYTKLGFRISGRLVKELNINGEFYDEFVMERLI